MSVTRRLDRAFAQALVLPFHRCSRYVLVSDCHRGVGTSSDNDPHKQTAVYPVHALGQPAPETGQQTVMFRKGLVKGKGQTEILCAVGEPEAAQHHSDP